MMTGAKMRSEIAKKSFACGLVILAVRNDYESGLITEETFVREMAYWRGRLDAYKKFLEETTADFYRRQKAELASLLDDANITHSYE